MTAARPRFRAVTSLVLASALLGGCDVSGGGVRFDLERMIDQRRLDAYEASSLFDDGMAMRTPPEGVLPFGEAVPAAVRTGREGDRPVGRIPLPVDSLLLAEGRREFDAYCAPCHGRDGWARTPVAAVMEIRPPPALHEERIRTMPPGQVFEVVRSGFGMMPGYSTVLDPHERWAVVAYLRALQLSRHLPVDTLPPAARAELLRRIEAGAGGPR